MPPLRPGRQESPPYRYKFPLPRAPPLFTIENVPLRSPATVTEPAIVIVLICGPDTSLTVPPHAAPVWLGTTNVPGRMDEPLLAAMAQPDSVN